MTKTRVLSACLILKAIAFVSPLASAADGCESIIALSRLRATTNSAEQRAFANAQIFCNDYEKGTNIDESTSMGAAYEDIAGTYGKSRSEQEQVYNKYCSSGKVAESEDRFFKSYVEVIAPGAYEAYRSCKSLGEGLRFTLGTGSILSKEFALVVNYINTTGAAKTGLIVTRSAGIDCKWQSGPISTSPKELIAPATDILSCSRPNQYHGGYVVLAQSGGLGHFTIPWPAEKKPAVVKRTWRPIFDNPDPRVLQVSNIDCEKYVPSPNKGCSALVTWRAPSPGKQALIVVMGPDSIPGLFACGSAGRKEAPWISEGVTRFRYIEVDITPGNANGCAEPIAGKQFITESRGFVRLE